MNRPEFNLNLISDLVLRDNFKKIQEFFQAETQWLGFKHNEYTFAAAATHQKIQHFLDTTPKDFILTYKSNSAAVVTIYYNLFDETHLDISCDVACVIRYFVGTYVEGYL